MSLRTCSALWNLRLGRLGGYGISMLVQQLVRTFRSSVAQPTDGVFPALTEMRVRTPFIEALKARERSSKGTQEQSSSMSAARDTSPKAMCESYHRVVCFH